MKTTLLKRSVPALVLCSLAVWPTQAKVIGTFGQVYTIAEPDALTEIEKRAKAVNWRSILDKERPEEFRPPNLVSLPRARHDRSFLVDMTYTLEFDVPDGRGGLLYPRGYRFNPLDYVPFNQTLVIIDGDDPEQLAWLKNSALLSEPDSLILLTQGAFSTIGEQLGRAVFYADRRILKRFNLAAVPSVVSRKGRLMEVREIEIPSAHCSAQ
jgi:conjugal transfer pilus assembly protein TraW